MTTFDSNTYRNELDQLCFSDEQKARMAQRLEAAARSNKVLELNGTQPTAGTRSDGNRDARRTTRWSASRTARSQRAHRRSPHRIAAAIGIAAVLAISGGTAYATGTFARAADSLAAVFGAGPAQTELIDQIGRPIGASCTSNGITITADAIIGMRNAYAVVYTIEKDDGTAFDELTMNQNGAYNLVLDGGGSINALTALRLGAKGSGGTRYTFDADPTDNAIQLVEMMRFGGSGVSLVGETLHFNATEIGFTRVGEDGRNLPSQAIATGDWNMSFKIDYEDLSVDLPAGQTFTINGNNAVVDELAVSPLGATITYTVDATDGASGPTGLETDAEKRVGHGDFTVTFADGTTQELGSGYTSWQQDGKTVVQKTWFFDQIRDVDDIASITVGDLTVPVQ
ncbi:DUF4179 domain-containing protein [Collinsella tanakaei]|uniref:DUF4179 domain-containing protein n=1 Tax=Collinsella tanakaei TaxID=626935 RepID=UPI0022E036E9|nr:DUF4179 domain-containing protein [Collinsella tanakaei]